jgi:hypothetical protein
MDIYYPPRFGFCDQNQNIRGECSVASINGTRSNTFHSRNDRRSVANAPCAGVIAGCAERPAIALRNLLQSLACLKFRFVSSPHPGEQMFSTIAWNCSGVSCSAFSFTTRTITCDVSIARDAHADYGLSKIEADELIERATAAARSWRNEATLLGIPKAGQELMAPAFEAVA